MVLVARPLNVLSATAIPEELEVLNFVLCASCLVFYSKHPLELGAGLLHLLGA